MNNRINLQQVRPDRFTKHILQQHLFKHHENTKPPTPNINHVDQDNNQQLKNKGAYPI